MTESIVVGQDAKTGFWYCKSLPAQNPREAGILMEEMDHELNKRNKTKVMDVEEGKKK